MHLRAIVFNIFVYLLMFHKIVTPDMELFLGEIGCLMALAYCHSKGDGVEENQEKAFEYHQLAAEKGIV